MKSTSSGSGALRAADARGIEQTKASYCDRRSAAVVRRSSSESQRWLVDLGISADQTFADSRFSTVVVRTGCARVVS